MVWLLGLERLTVKVKGVVPGGVLLVVPSGLTTSSMESTAVASSFWIVPVPTALTIVALVAPDRVTVDRTSTRLDASRRASSVAGFRVLDGEKDRVDQRRLREGGLPLFVDADVGF